MELDELNPFSLALSSGFSVCMCVCVQVMQVSINELCKGDFVCVCVLVVWAQLEPWVQSFPCVLSYLEGLVVCMCVGSYW